MRRNTVSHSKIYLRRESDSAPHSYLKRKNGQSAAPPRAKTSGTKVSLPSLNDESSRTSRTEPSDATKVTDPLVREEAGGIGTGFRTVEELVSHLRVKDGNVSILEELKKMSVAFRRPTTKIPSQFHMFEASPLRQSWGVDDSSVSFDNESNLFRKKIFPSECPKSRVEVYLLWRTLCSLIDECALNDLNIRDMDVEKILDEQLKLFDISVTEVVRHVSSYSTELAVVLDHVKDHFKFAFQRIPNWASHMSAPKEDTTVRLKELTQELESVSEDKKLAETRLKNVEQTLARCKREKQIREQQVSCLEEDLSLLSERVKQLLARRDQPKDSKQFYAANEETQCSFSNSSILAQDVDTLVSSLHVVSSAILDRLPDDGRLPFVTFLREQFDIAESWKEKKQNVEYQQLLVWLENFVRQLGMISSSLPNFEKEFSPSKSVSVGSGQDTRYCSTSIQTDSDPRELDTEPDEKQIRYAREVMEEALSEIDRIGVQMKTKMETSSGSSGGNSLKKDLKRGSRVSRDTPHTSTDDGGSSFQDMFQYLGTRTQQLAAQLENFGVLKRLMREGKKKRSKRSVRKEKKDMETQTEEDFRGHEEIIFDDPDADFDMRNFFEDDAPILLLLEKRKRLSYKNRWLRETMKVSDEEFLSCVRSMDWLHGIINDVIRKKIEYDTNDRHSGGSILSLPELMEDYLLAQYGSNSRATTAARYFCCTMEMNVENSVSVKTLALFLTEKWTKDIWMMYCAAVRIDGNTNVGIQYPVPHMKAMNHVNRYLSVKRVAAVLEDLLKYIPTFVGNRKEFLQDFFSDLVRFDAKPVSWETFAKEYGNQRETPSEVELASPEKNARWNLFSVEVSVFLNSLCTRVVDKKS